MNRQVGVFLIAYAVLAILTFSNLDVTISNSYQRAVAAGYIADYVKGDLWSARSPSDVMAAFAHGQEHYKIFSGIADWPPLQLMILIASFLIFGLNWAGFIVAPLAITLLTLYYLYQLARLEHDHKTALLTIVLVGISTFFFYEAATPMLENGLALFTAACTYYFLRYLKNDKTRDVYFATAMFALGFLYKVQMVLILPALALLFFWKKDVKLFFTTRKNYRLLALSFGIFVLICSPLIVREIALTQQGVSTFFSRSVGRVGFITGESSGQSGWLVANDFEFEDSLPEHKRDLIVNRYNLSYLQKLFITLSSLFFNLALLPAIIFGIWKSKKTSTNTLILLFVATNILFFGLHGLIPRYMIPTAALLAIFAAHGIRSLPRKTIVPAAAIVILITLAQTIFFFAQIAQGEHIQSMQHDYERAAEYLLANTEGEFTIITTRPYQMAFFMMKHDTDRRAYVEIVPQDKSTFEQMLAGNFRTPELLEGKDVAYSTKRPPVRYVVVHEKLETGPLRESADYNLRTELESNPSVKLATLIDSPFLNSQTWIYAIS